MIRIIEKKICDICGEEVEDFAGRFELRHYDGTVYHKSDHDYKEVCTNCCEKLDKVIGKVTDNRRY